ncbi:MAG: GH36-type glycosyl hydrolase domain-containing protein [Rhizobacter sp.]
MAPSELRRLIPDATPALCDILDGARGRIEPPIRSEIFGLQRFAQHGRSLGETHRAARAGSRSAAFFPRLRNNIQTLREAHRYIGLQARTGYDISPAAEWLLDNFHLIEAQLEEIHEGLPRRYFRALPVLLDEPLAGLPRVYGVAWAFVAHTDGAFDEDLLIQFLSAYQETRELTLGEMWALPTTLRVVLIENLRRLAERVATNKAAREVANLCCDRIDSTSVAALDDLLALLDRRGVARVFLAQMALRMQDGRTTSQGGNRASDHADARAAQHEWLRRSLPDPAAMQAQQRADQTADNLSVSNAVTSLRAIGDADWTDIVARSSTLMHMMLGSPVFEAEHTMTRDRTLHGIERLARQSGRSEVSVAQTLLGLMHASQAGPGAVEGASVASHWLSGAGRPALMQALGLSERAAASWRAVARRLALPAYLGSLLLVTLAVVAWLLRHGGGLADPGVSVGLLWLGAALMLFPASEAVVAVINRLISESARPAHLPRLALTAGIPVEHRVMVVIPAMMTDAASIRALVHRLQLHHLANPERHAQFALLTDWADADSARVETDEGLLTDATQQIAALNARYPTCYQGGRDELTARTPAPPRFILLHRERRYSETEQRWIGWERKRGKLEQLITVLADPASSASASTESAFIDLGEASRIADGTKYIVTLDSDTQLPPGRLHDLVGVAAHPHNQPQVDATGRGVVSGYAILQPRIVTPLPTPKDFTLYHWLFAGQCGIDPYSAATSEVYQDVFGEGTYTGKGLLHVHAMHSVLSGRLPEGRVLSHDLLEGSIARCAAVTDITLIEDAPFHADVAASRVHRWTRGDWQLLPFLVDSLSRNSRYHLRSINRWKMFDNLRRSLVAPMSLALLLLALVSSVVSPWLAFALVLAAFSAGPLMGAVAGFSPSRDDIAQRYFYRQAAADLARALCGGAWLLALLPAQSVLALDAIGRAVYRMAISRRHLLQWTTAAAAQARAKTALPALVLQHWREPVLAGVLLGTLLAAGTPSPRLAIGLCLLWAASPAWTWWVSRPRPASAEEALSIADQDYFESVARDTWRLFERCVVADENHLPPDNLQTLPYDMVAHRTSPTNIGLYLLSTACARQFGWIEMPELITRMEATLATLSKLQRHRGHFMNWYDTQTLSPLLPMYVSTVDSGNLSGHLLAVAQACLEWTHDPQHRPTPQTAARLEALADQCETIAWQADFSFLYHRKRHLFHIGYRVAEQQLDAGFYDLLASESRLTSLLAIAKGDAPVRHWASLGRMFYAVGGDAGLRSWSGSMFEYLMPTLVLDEPHGSVLRGACHAALHEQIAYAQTQSVPGREVPWGISESAYAGRDHTLAYQYAPQGVPRLALRRTPPDELVVAPYATALAAQIAPHLARLNFAALESLAPRERYGFIEALDFTAARKVGEEPFTPVSTFMAHHQGMTIVALANVLLSGVAQRWGMANPHIEAMASLLHERAPREVSMLYEPPAAPLPPALQRRAPGLLREVFPGATALEPTHVLSNGRYSVSLRANGAGWSRWGTTGITRSRDDALRDSQGSFFYLRRQEGARGSEAARTSSPLLSITQHPAPDPAAHYRSVFHADRVCFDATWPELQAHTTVWVSPEDDIEFRQIELRNLGDDVLDIELISAFEVTLADPRADEAHPAFSNLFVRAEWQAEQQALLFERTPRLATENGLQAAHFLAESDPQVVSIRVQTDRQRWLGRNRSPDQPQASFDPLPDTESGTPATLDTGLDPVCAMAVRLRIEPQGKALLTFATTASDNGGTLRAVIDKYRQASHVKRASLMSATLASIRFRTLRISTENFDAIQTLTTALVLTLTRPRTHAARLNEAVAGVCDRRLLWRFGISGDRPIVLVSAGAPEGLGLIRSLAQALRLWSWSGVACDLVVLNAEPASYLMAVQRELGAMRERHDADSGAEFRPASASGPSSTGLHLLRADEISADELSTLQSVARVRLQADGRPLTHHVQEWVQLHEQAFEQRHEISTAPVILTQKVGAAVPATTGAFSAASGEFRFGVSANSRPVRPWVNVLANREFGTQLTEAGGGYTWAVNSRMNQLTAWSNDPVGDTPSEWLLLQDLKTLDTWSIAPSAWGDDSVPYRIAHGQGYSVISHRRGDVEVTASWCVDPQTSVKQVRVRLVNRGHRTLLLRVVGIAEWMMGANRSDRATVHTALHRQRLPDVPTSNAAADGSRSQKLTALTATQPERSAGFGDGTAFLAIASSDDRAEKAENGDDWTCDRRECFDARGRLVLPDHFGQRSGSGLDPCAALSTRVSLLAGESVERVFLLGYAESPDAARQLATLAAATPAVRRMEAVRESWDALLGATTVQTPDPLFDAMVNRWLLYQTVSCRLWARAGFYQAGGAYGFRDQLQDAMALTWAAPAMLRDQIVLGASRQFAEGDVQHWWHAPGGAGVRTHFSDDLLWLPHACVRYLRATGDTDLLDVSVPFIEGAPIPDGAEDAYYAPTVSGEQASVYEHAARAIDHSLRVGAHGLPLMGTGDWNDGMNRVGHEGRGESVWLGWFLCELVGDFAPVARDRGDEKRALDWEAAARGWREALNGAAWDGQWFKRAFFDDGQALGSHANDEARIDLIAQAWAVLSGAASPERQREAMQAVETHLVDHEAGLIKLLDPPLAHAQPSAGYIQAYPAGVRENGGQYSHAGVWALMAQARLQLDAAAGDPTGVSARPDVDLPYRYFTCLSPAHRAAHPTHGAIYGIEPYVMAGDVYTKKPYVGRGGWSWYTGAAAWMHRAAIESIFGLRQGAHTLSFAPCLPSHWPQAELTLKSGQGKDSRTMRFILIRPAALADLETTAPWGAQILHPGDLLAWRDLAPQSCFVIPLPPLPDSQSGIESEAVADRIVTSAI